MRRPCLLLLAAAFSFASACKRSPNKDSGALKDSPSNAETVQAPAATCENLTTPDPEADIGPGPAPKADAAPRSDGESSNADLALTQSSADGLLSKYRELMTKYGDTIANFKKVREGETDKDYSNNDKLYALRVEIDKLADQIKGVVKEYNDLCPKGNMLPKVDPAFDSKGQNCNIQITVDKSTGKRVACAMKGTDAKSVLRDAGACENSKTYIRVTGASTACSEADAKFECTILEQSCVDLDETVRNPDSFIFK